MKIWETFLKIEPNPDLAPEMDATWCLSRGIDPDAPVVIKLLRDEVLPLVTRLEKNGLSWYSFLTHNRDSGVPTTADDKNAYIHLRLDFAYSAKSPVSLELGPLWTMTREVEQPKEIAGISCDALLIDQAWDLIGEQSQWLLFLIQSHQSDSIPQLVIHIRQYLHFFANMCQIRVM